MKKIYLFAYIITLFMPLYSQTWFNEQEKPLNNFYYVRNQFLKEWGDKNTEEKGNGWKPFKRWEWFWEQRVYPTGEFPSNYNRLQINQSRSRKANQKEKNQIQTTYPWSMVTPYENTDAFQGTGRVNVVITHPDNPQEIFVGTASGGLWRSFDNGVNWSTTTDELESIGVSDIAINYNSSNIMYIATGDRDHNDTRSIGVLKSVDAGSTWNTTGLTFNTSNYISIHRLLMHPYNPSILYAGTTNGLYITTDAGVTWSRTFTNSVGDLEFRPNDPQTMYLVNSTRIYKSVDGGYNWTQLTLGLPTASIQRIKLAVTPANTNYVYALYSNTSSSFLGLYKSEDMGESWSLKSSTPNILGWSSNGSGTGGQAWYDLAMEASQTNAELIYIGGINVWYSLNGGVNWTYFNSGMHVDIHDLYFIPGTDILYCGNDGGVYRKASGATSWTWLGKSLPITQFYRLGTSETVNGLVIAGAQDNGTKLHTGTTVRMCYGGDGMEAVIDYNNQNNIYACSQNGGLGRSTNGGTSFVGIKPSGSTGAWITPYVLSPSNPNTIYAGFNEIYKSTNNGTNWTTISSFGSSTGMNILQVAPSNENYIYTGKSSGFLRKTTNGGTLWASIPYPGTQSLTSIAIHQSDPNKLWACNSGYVSGSKVFYSSDGGLSWINISKNLPNVPCNSIVYQNDSPNRVFVGTDIGVFYKDEFTSDWVDYNDNFPNVVVDELEINYLSNKLKAATFGRGLWQVSLPDTRLFPAITGKDSVCCKSVNMYYTQANINYSYQWKVTNGTIMGSANKDTVIVQWDKQTAGSLKIIVYHNQFGVMDSTKRDFYLIPLPNPQISGASVACCGDTVIYEADSFDGLNNQWYVKNGKILGAPNLASIRVVWQDSCNSLSAQKSIKLVQTNNSGCKDSSIINLTVNPLPVAQIQGPGNVCIKKESIYSSLFNDDYTYNWSVKGGKLTNLGEGKIKVVWDSLPTGKIDLLVTHNITGCTNKSSVIIGTVESPTMKILGNLNTCINSSEVYSTISEINYAYKWIVDNGKIIGSDDLQTVEIEWKKDGKNILKLIKTQLNNYCSDTILAEVNVNKELDMKIAGVENTYQNTVASYNNTISSGEVVSWSVENGKIINDKQNSIDVFWFKFDSGKISLIKLNPITNCRDTNYLMVKLINFHKLEISGSQNVCIGDTITYTTPSTNDFVSEWLINGGRIINKDNTSIKVVWETGGNSSIELVKSNSKVGFIDTLIYPVKVNFLPEKPIITLLKGTLVSSAETGNQWFLNGKQIVGAISKNYIPKEEGTYTVIVTDPISNCKSLMSNPIVYSFESVETYELGKYLTISPNPNDGKFSIQISDEISYINAEIRFIDLIGNEVFNEKLSESRNLKFDLNLTPGVYFIRIIFDNEKIVNGKIIINKK